MGFRYLNRIATPEHLTEFLELADLAAGGGADAGNVFELSRRLQHSTPMRLCIKRLLHDADAAALIASRKVAGPYDQASLLSLPKGSLGHTYATVMQTMGYDINFFPEPAFTTTWPATPITSTTGSTRPTTSTTSSAASASITTAKPG